MSDKHTKRPWSLRRKVLVGGIIALIVLGLALGLGLGFGLGGGNGDDNDNQPPTSTLTPLPSPNNTLPWTPKVNDTWQIILSHPPLLAEADTATTPNVSIFDIDLFDTPTETITKLHKLGKKVICYFSAGSYEDWRPDAKNFTDADKGKQLDGWPGEKWLKLSSSNVRAIMKKRIELAGRKGCDGVDPDNIDGYGNANGLGLTQEDSITYIQYLASVARPMNMTIGLKNAGDIITSVLPVVDFSVNEQCMQYNECSTFHAFIDVGKPVFHIEYPGGDGDLAQGVETSGFSVDLRKKSCGNGDDDGKKAGIDGFSTLLKKMALDGWVQYCNGTVVNTKIAT